MVDLPGKESRTGQAGNKFSIVSFLLLLFLIICIAFLVYLKNQNDDISNLDVKELFKSSFLKKAGTDPVERLISETEYDVKEHPVFEVYKDSLIKCTKDSIMCLDKKGEILWTKSVSMSNPLIRVSGSNILIADLNGRYFYVLNGKEITWDQKVDSNIVSADINDKGYIAIVKDMKGYKGAVEVYDPQGSWAFTSAKGENFIISAKVLPSGEGVVANMLDTSGVNADTRFEFIGMSGKAISNISRNNAIFPSIWPINGDNVIAVSDSEVICFKDDKKIKWTLAFEKILSSNSILGKNIVLAVKDNRYKGTFGGGKSSIKVINASGEATSELDVDGEVQNMEVFGNVIAVNSGREVYFINSKGKLINKYTSKTDILEVKLFSKEEAAIITKGNIVVTRIN